MWDTYTVQFDIDIEKKIDIEKRKLTTGNMKYSKMNINMQTFNDNMICDNHGLDPWEKIMSGDVKNIVTTKIRMYWLPN